MAQHSGRRRRVLPRRELSAWAGALGFAASGCASSGDGDSAAPGDTAPPLDTAPAAETGLADSGGSETTEATSDARIAVIVALNGQVAAGLLLYANACTLCHGVNGTGSSGEFKRADLTASSLDEVGVVTTVVRGRPTTPMASYAYDRDQQIAALTPYLLDAFIP